MFTDKRPLFLYDTRVHASEQQIFPFTLLAYGPAHAANKARKMVRETAIPDLGQVPVDVTLLTSTGGYHA
jgi:hypothetical protein